MQMQSSQKQVLQYDLCPFLLMWLCHVNWLDVGHRQASLNVVVADIHEIICWFIF